jgi:hypothetical protein
MSRYSGRCDLADTLKIHNYTLEELQNNVEIYVGRDTKPLHIEKMEDLIPYYPYLIVMAWYNNLKGKSVIHLTSESYVDIEERKTLEFRLKCILKIYNRCKRKKIEFDAEEAIKDVTLNGWNEEPYRELANRVKENGKKANIDGIHLRMYERYRQELVNEMLKNGINPADIGNNYQRFINKEV